mgnify:FL=1
MPFLGFPGSYKTFFIIVSGLAVIFLAFLRARDKRITQIRNEGPRREIVTEGFVENQPETYAETRAGTHSEIHAGIHRETRPKTFPAEKTF